MKIDVPAAMRARSIEGADCDAVVARRRGPHRARQQLARIRIRVGNRARSPPSRGQALPKRIGGEHAVAHPTTRKDPDGKVQQPARASYRPGPLKAERGPSRWENAKTLTRGPGFSCAGRIRGLPTKPWSLELEWLGVPLRRGPWVRCSQPGLRRLGGVNRQLSSESPLIGGPRFAAGHIGGQVRMFVENAR